MTHAVYFFCPGRPPESIAAKYERALAKLGSHELIWVCPPGRSSVFARLAHHHRNGNGRVLPGLLAAYPTRAAPTTISVVSYSAGYGYVRELLKHPVDRASVDAYVAIDSIHSGLSGDGPVPATMEGFVALARRAAAGSDCRLWLGHTDVRTPQSGAGAFASTTQCAEYMLDQVGPPHQGWLVRAYDEYPDSRPKKEHANALTGWGPAFVRDCLVPLLSGHHVPDLPELPWHNPELSLGARALEWSFGEYAAGVAEMPPGSNTGPRIRQYLAPCIRKGKRLGLRAGAWCAAAACYAARSVRMPGDTIPHSYRCSGLELQQDAARNGCWVPVEALRAGDAFLAPGDLVIYQRGTGWQRHVARVATSDASTVYTTLGGNERDAWRMTDRDLGDELLLGAIPYPQPRPCTRSIEHASRMYMLSRSCELGVDDMQHALSVIDGGYDE